MAVLRKIGEPGCCGSNCFAGVQGVLRRAPQVKLTSGSISGELDPGNVAHFNGVPFAAPPTGKRRWRRPVPPEAWPGCLDCTSKRPKGERRAWPVQPPCGDMGGVAVSEDCLHLDVWAPAGGLTPGRACAGSDVGAPVIVWIYGGGLLGGSKDYVNSEGRVYAERGVIFISANYRVGVLGFLVPEGGDANCGLWDQVEVLRWVQREIRAFGGDPKRVTIMGQSAGADSCYFLASSPVANKLFQRAIIQSPASFTTTKAQAQELVEEFASVAGACSASLADLQALTADDVLRAQHEGRFRVHPSTGPGWRVMNCFGTACPELPLPDPTPSGLFRFPEDRAPKSYFYPTAVVDGELLEEPPLDALLHGVAAHLDIIIGGNREEDAAPPHGAKGALHQNFGIQLAKNEGHAEIVNRMAWELAGMPRLLQASPGQLQSEAARLVSAYDEERRADVFGLGPHGRASSPEQWLLDTMASDFSFLAAVLLVSERLALPNACSRVFRYQFNGHGGRGDAFHAAELELLMGEEHKMIAGSKKVRDEWLDSWAAFAKSGDPNTSAMAGSWRPYSDADRPVLFWDGLHGWMADGGPVMSKRTALRATAQLWERLWDVHGVL